MIGCRMWRLESTKQDFADKVRDGALCETPEYAKHLLVKGIVNLLVELAGERKAFFPLRSIVPHLKELSVLRDFGSRRVGRLAVSIRSSVAEQLGG